MDGTLMHPSHTAQISVAEIRTIAKGWRVHGKAARGAGESLIADIWESAADELDAAAQQARERFHTAKIAAEDTKRRTIQRVKDLAAARQLAAQAQKLKNESERLDAQADKYLESGYMLAASEQVNAATRAMQQAERAEHALQIVCEVCEIDPTEL